jgi:hypothetical protein
MLMLFTEVMAICYVNYTEHINTVRVGRTQNFWKVKHLVLVVTTGLFIEVNNTFSYNLFYTIHVTYKPGRGFVLQDSNR